MNKPLHGNTKCVHCNARYNSSKFDGHNRIKWISDTNIPVHVLCLIPYLEASK